MPRCLTAESTTARAHQRYGARWGNGLGVSSDEAYLPSLTHRRAPARRARLGARQLQQESALTDILVADVLLDSQIEDVDIDAAGGYVKHFSLTPPAINLDLDNFADDVVHSSLLSHDGLIIFPSMGIVKRHSYARL